MSLGREAGEEIAPTSIADRGARQAAARPGRAGRGGFWALSQVRWAAAATVLFVAGWVVQLLGAPSSAWWPLHVTCCLVGGWRPGMDGLRALGERRLDVDLLMMVAAFGALAIGQAADAALLVVIFATSGALEAFATRRTEDSIAGLLDLAPETATLLDSDGVERTVRTADLQVGDVILVRPGDRVGGDGQVLDGTSDVDQATITGEPLPVPKQVGDDVFAGTLNGAGALKVRVGTDPAESVIARIAALVEEASATKAPTQLLIESVEQRYSVAMVAATLVLFSVPLALGEALSSALLRAMTFMVVASPCAVVLATMPPLLAAIATAGRHGVLVKSAVVMERLGATTLVALDKTGTLTEGRPHVTEVRALPGAGLDEPAVLRLAGAAEGPSEHPLARAIVDAALQEAPRPLPPVSGFTSVPGRGVAATVDGHAVEVGSPAHLLDAGSGSGAGTNQEAVAAAVAELGAAGYTALLVTVDDAPVGVVGVAARLRPDAADAVTRLTVLTGADPVMLTGDNPRSAAHVAAEAGIREVRADLLPHDKVTAVRDLETAGHRLLLVGDGVNDAPALAAAQTGLAMGRAGSDLALETADAVIVRDELATVPSVIALAKRARRVVIANLVFAASCITVLVAWGLFGHLPLPLGVAGHEGSTVIVALNGLRLLRSSAWP